MKAMIAALAVLCVQQATPAMAQADQAQTATTAPVAAAPMVKSHPPTHEMCKAVMGKKMDPKNALVHGAHRVETGAPSKAEMARLHKACGEMMHGTTPGAPHPMPKP